MPLDPNRFPELQDISINIILFELHSTSKVLYVYTEIGRPSEVSTNFIQETHIVREKYIKSPPPKKNIYFLKESMLKKYARNVFWITLKGRIFEPVWPSIVLFSISAAGHLSPKLCQ